MPSRLSALTYFSSADLAAPSVPFVLAAFPHVNSERPEEILAENEHFIRQLTAAMPDILYVFGLRRSVARLPERPISAMLGYNKAEIIELGTSIIETLVYPDDLQELPRLISRYSALKDGEILEHRISCPDIRTVSCAGCEAGTLFSSDCRMEKRRRYLRLAHDITDRKLINESVA
jgi:PAS domain-containing protein